jgi:hypothetical protein
MNFVFTFNYRVVWFWQMWFLIMIISQRLLLFAINLSIWTCSNTTSYHLCSILVNVSSTHPSRWLRFSFHAYYFWRLHSRLVTFSKCSWAIVFVCYCPLMATIFSLSDISICSTTSSKPYALCSMTFIEVLRSRMAFVMDFFLLLPNPTNIITCPLKVRFSY